MSLPNSARIPAISNMSVIGGGITLLFGQKVAACPASHNDQFALRQVYVSKRGLVNGAGNQKMFHLAAWENPGKPGEFQVGSLFELWPFGNQYKGMPLGITLRLHSSHDSIEAATKACEQLACDNTFSTLVKLIQDGGDSKFPVLSRTPHILPFIRPLHWTGWVRSAYIPAGK